MSRTIKGGKGPGYEYWTRRPGNKFGGEPGSAAKRITHGIERAQGRAMLHAADSLDRSADAADSAFEAWECDQIDRLYAHLGDDCPFEHYPVSSRTTPEYTQLLRRQV